MTVKITSKPVKICPFIVFPMCLKVKTLMLFAEFFSEQIFFVLIISKSSCCIALTIANAPRTLCADSCVALTSFAFPIEEVDEDCGGGGRSAVYLPACLPNCDFRAAI